MEKFLVLAMALQVSLYVIVMVIFVRKRTSLVKAGKVPSSYYKTFQTEVGEYPRDLKAAERHFENLFEMPVLFLIFCSLVIGLGKVDLFIVLGSYLYVLIRVAHMVIHIGKNKIMPRMMAFGFSCLVLIIMWVYLTISMFFNS